MDPLTIGLLVLALGLLLLSSLTRDLRRAFLWFMRTLGRVMITLAIIGLAYTLLFRL